MIYNEVSQFIRDDLIYQNVRNCLTASKRMVDHWNNNIHNNYSIIEDIALKIVMEEFNRYANYLTLWWEDSDDVSPAQMTFLKMMRPIILRYGRQIEKIINSFIFMLKDNQWTIENVTGSVNKLSRNEGYSNFQSSSVDAQNNWSNVVVRNDKSDVGDLFTLFQFYSEDVFQKMVDEIALNTMVMIYV